MYYIMCRSLVYYVAKDVPNRGKPHDVLRVRVRKQHLQRETPKKRKTKAGPNNCLIKYYAKTLMLAFDRPN